MKLVSKLLPAALLAIVLTGCGDPTSFDLEPGSVMQQLQAGHEMGSRERTARNVFEAMPNVTFVGLQGERFTVSEAVVTGQVVDVTVGKSFTWNDGGIVRIELPFHDEQAMASPVHLELRVDQVIAVRPGPDLPSTVAFGLAVAPDIDVDAARAELKGLGTLVVYLIDDSPVFDYDANLFAVLEDGAFLGVVGADGAVTFPAMDPIAALAPAGLNLADLLAAATEQIELPANR